MSDDGIAALMRVATRVAAGQRLTTHLMGEEGVPAALRLVLAAVALTAADRAVNKKSIAAAAPAARSATYRDHAELLEQVKTLIPALVQAQLGLVGTHVSASELARQLENANNIIHDERQLRETAEKRLGEIASYARELHWKLKPEYEATLRERIEKVRPLRSLPAADADIPPV